MGPQMMGPPPQELLPKLRILKILLAMELIAGCMKMISDIVLQSETGGNAIAPVIDFLILFLNCVAAIWLLSDDPDVRRLYECLVRTFCSGCADQCRGGLQCLLPLVLINVVAFVVQLLNKDLQRCYLAFKLVFSAQQITLSVLIFFVFGLSTLVIFAAEIGNALVGCQAYSAAQRATSGVTAQEGNWGQSGNVRFARERADEGQAREARPAAGFEAFQGGGNRLGGGS